MRGDAVARATVLRGRQETPSGVRWPMSHEELDYFLCPILGSAPIITRRSAIDAVLYNFAAPNVVA